MILDAAGNLYGTTSEGGSWGFGTVFELTPPVAEGALWTETILYNFESSDFPYDGDLPRTAPAFDHSGDLYGTTSGSTDKICLDEGALCSTVYELTPPASVGGDWTETVLHTFGPPVADKAVGGTMLDGKGNVYGATQSGVIYRLRPPPTTGRAWTYEVLYDFDSAECGESPEGSLTLRANGHLYGTTLAGGANFGTVFELVPPANPGWRVD